MDHLRKIQEASQILKDMNYPTNLLDEKASLCLIVLTGKEIQLNWKDSYSRKIGRFPILQFINEFYGKSNDYRSLVSVQKRLYPLLDFGNCHQYGIPNATNQRKADDSTNKQ